VFVIRQLQRPTSRISNQAQSKFLERTYEFFITARRLFSSPERDGPLFHLASSRLSLSLFITLFSRCDFNLLYSHMSQRYYRFSYIPAPAEYSYHLPYPASSIRVVPLRSNTVEQFTNRARHYCILTQCKMSLGKLPVGNKRAAAAGSTQQTDLGPPVTCCPLALVPGEEFAA
jgi:hypothetical protein